MSDFLKIPFFFFANEQIINSVDVLYSSRTIITIFH